jgi:Transposase, Mutator family
VRTEASHTGACRGSSRGCAEPVSAGWGGTLGPALHAGGITVRDMAAHLCELYGCEIGRETVSWVTDAVLEDVAARPPFTTNG